MFINSPTSVLQADLLVVSCDLVVADEDHAVQSLHALADVYRKHSAMVAMLIASSVNFTDATVTCPGGKHRRRIGLCVFRDILILSTCLLYTSPSPRDS